MSAKLLTDIHPSGSGSLCLSQHLKVRSAADSGQRESLIIQHAFVISTAAVSGSGSWMDLHHPKKFKHNGSAKSSPPARRVATKIPGGILPAEGRRVGRINERFLEGRRRIALKEGVEGGIELSALPWANRYCKAECNQLHYNTAARWIVGKFGGEGP